ncbi:MAG: hypothetical protein ACI87E_002569 [Mariniblastus sp.]
MLGFCNTWEDGQEVLPPRRHTWAEVEMPKLRGKVAGRIICSQAEHRSLIRISNQIPNWELGSESGSGRRPSVDVHREGLRL